MRDAPRHLCRERQTRRSGSGWFRHAQRSTPSTAVAATETEQQSKMGASRFEAVASCPAPSEPDPRPHAGAPLIGQGLCHESGIGVARTMRPSLTQPAPRQERSLIWSAVHTPSASQSAGRRSSMTSENTCRRSGSSNCSKKERPKVSRPSPDADIELWVGRGTSMMALTAKPPCSSSLRYSATEGKNQGATLSDRRHAGRRPRVWRWRWPPHCHDRQIRRRSGRAGEAPGGRRRSRAQAGASKCSAALVNTASNSSSKGSAWPSDLLHLEALGGSGGEQLLAQIGAKHVGAARGDLLQSSTPSPQPRSRMRSPSLGASRSSTGRASSETKRPFAGVVVGLTSAAPASAVSFARRSFRRSRLPRLVVARDRLPGVWIEDAAGRPIGLRRASEVGLIGIAARA